MQRRKFTGGCLCDEIEYEITDGLPQYAEFPTDPREVYRVPNAEV